MPHRRSRESSEDLAPRQQRELSQHADSFKRVLARPDSRSSSERADSLSRLASVPAARLHSLSTDAHHELGRRQSTKGPHNHGKAGLSEGQSKLASLSEAQFHGLVSDLHAEIMRRSTKYDSDSESDSGSETRSGSSDESSSSESRHKSRSRAKSHEGESTKSVIRKAEQLARDAFKHKDVARDWLHVDRVRKTALSLAKHLKEDGGHRVDLRVVELASILHDIGADASKKDDAESLLRPFLSKHESKIKKAQADLVIRIVEAIGVKKESKPKSEKDRHWEKHCYELHCVADADALDAIGAIGILRCAATAGVSNRLLYDPVDEDEEAGGHEHSKAGSVVAQIQEKLYRVPELMRTEKGKKLAEHRFRFLQRFVYELQRESEE